MSFIAGLIVGICFGIIIHELIENWVNMDDEEDSDDSK